MKLSIVIPAYNEVKTIAEVLRRVSSVPQEKEIIVVDDCSRDGTREVLKGIRIPGVKVVYHERNMGKGAGIRSGLEVASGDAVIVQDADLEYDPMEYVSLVKPLEDGRAIVVYGSRFKGGGEFLPASRVANLVLTGLTNLLYGSRITDMETCYKLMRMDVARSLSIESKGFEVEPEVTAKILRQGIRIWEVPIRYRGRGTSEGKKIGWRDGLKAIATLIRYRFRR